VRIAAGAAPVLVELSVWQLDGRMISRQRIRVSPNAAGSLPMPSFTGTPLVYRIRMDGMLAKEGVIGVRAGR
jgi:hypothetical protein